MSQLSSNHFASVAAAVFVAFEDYAGVTVAAASVLAEVASDPTLWTVYWELEQELEIDFDDDETDRMRTVADLIALCADKVGAAKMAEAV